MDLSLSMGSETDPTKRSSLSLKSAKKQGWYVHVARKSSFHFFFVPAVRKIDQLQ